MSPSCPIRALAGVALRLAIVIASLSGCAATRPEGPATGEARSAQAAPAADFSAALRCMDTLLLDYGVRDVSVLIEALAGPGEGSGGAREMLVAAVSDMTQRSRAIRLVGSDKDWSDTVKHVSQAQNREPIAAVPQYALRGSVSQLDRASPLALGIDLNLLTTRDMSIVPGIAARAAIARSAGGAQIRKFGIGYAVAAQDRAQATRALVEVAAMELFGRLAKVPYWTCLGATDAERTVAAEIQDWYDALAARPAEIIRYTQGQLRLRRAYEGPIDGAVNPELKDAVARYREALGLAREPKLSLDFFRAYLAADHHRIAARFVVTVPNPPAQAEAPALALQLAAGDNARRFARGESIRLTIRPTRDAHVYCFLQDEEQRISRFFPNRFQRDSRVRSAEALQLPGAMRFEILMNPRGVGETVVCFATEHDVQAHLPAAVNGGDFSPLAVTTLEQVRAAFTQAAGGRLAQASLALQPR